MMEVKDIQTGKMFRFLINKWFAVEEGDGQVSHYFKPLYIPGTIFNIHFANANWVMNEWMKHEWRTISFIGR